MKLFVSTIVFISTVGLHCFSQTDEDVMRYSNIGIGGTTRSLAMGGAMGALGGDMSCAHYNPAGLGIMVKTDLNLGFGLNFSNTSSMLNQSTNSKFSPALTFNFIGISGTNPDKNNIKNKYTFAITLNQLQNFNQQINIQGRPTHGKSITLDMLDYAKGKPYNKLDPVYEGAAYYTYVIDMLDTNNFNSYFSFIDTSKSFLQHNTISKSGRINELAFSFAYSFNENVYLGASIGVPFLKYAYMSDYAEIDDKNQMYINKINDSTYVSSYPYTVNYYQGFGGIKDFHYITNYTTTATGINIKVGTIIRASDYLRFGLYYHSPTWYSAKDIYYYTFVSDWDEGQSININTPNGGGMYNYKIITPSKIGLSASGIINNWFSINTDYELIDYRQGLLKSGDVGVFDNANKAIKEKYTLSGNFKFGVELNTKPIIFRAGWASFGSPFGNQFAGNNVRNAFSIGIGYKGTNFYYDVAIIKTFIGKQLYYMYNPKYCDPTNIKTNLTQIVFTIGLMGKRYDSDIDYDKYNNPDNKNALPPNSPNNNNKPVIPY